MTHDGSGSRSTVYRLAFIVTELVLGSLEEVSEEYREIKKVLRLVRYAVYGVVALVGIGVVFEVIWILVGLRRLFSGLSLGLSGSLVPAAIGFVVGYVVCLVTVTVFSIAK
ncbi:MAG: hypothetical protein SV253_10275 [Halobacteria archaeon]|nr:hypothetical protein [Halobacteria archaeon]